MSYFISPGPDSSLEDIYYFHMLRLGGPDSVCLLQLAALPGLWKGPETESTRQGEVECPNKQTTATKFPGN